MTRSEILNKYSCEEQMLLNILSKRWVLESYESIEEEWKEEVKIKTRPLDEFVFDLKRLYDANECLTTWFQILSDIKDHLRRGRFDELKAGFFRDKQKFKDMEDVYDEICEYEKEFYRLKAIEDKRPIVEKVYNHIVLKWKNKTSESRETIIIFVVFFVIVLTFFVMAAVAS